MTLPIFQVDIWRCTQDHKPVRGGLSPCLPWHSLSVVVGFSRLRASPGLGSAVAGKVHPQGPGRIISNKSNY